MAQFNKDRDSARWFTLVYQSNNELNAELPVPQAKLHIARLLLENFTIIDMRSYMHCMINFSIETGNPLAKFDEITTFLNDNAPPDTPPWFFSLTLVTQTTGASPKNILFAAGDTSMNERFRHAIEEMGFTHLRPLPE